MNSRKIIFHETAIVAAGELICCAALVGTFAILGRLQLNVLWGAVGGSCIVTANYFLMAIIAYLAAECAVRGQTQQAKKMIQLSSVSRLILMGLALFVGIWMGANVIALVLPLLFMRPILLVAGVFRKKGN